MRFYSTENSQEPDFFLFSSNSVPRTRTQLQILDDAIRKQRVKAGLSQELLAEKTGLHPVYVGKIERGEQWISLRALLRIAKAAGVRVREFGQGL